LVFRPIYPSREPSDDSFAPKLCISHVTLSDCAVATYAEFQVGVGVFVLVKNYAGPPGGQVCHFFFSELLSSRWIEFIMV
jgi:hypothetical protein